MRYLTFAKEHCRFSCDTVTTSKCFVWELLRKLISSNKINKCVQPFKKICISLFFSWIDFLYFWVCKKTYKDVEQFVCALQMPQEQPSCVPAFCRRICRIDQEFWVVICCLSFVAWFKKAVGQVSKCSCRTEMLSQVRNSDNQLLHKCCLFSKLTPCSR